MIFCPIKEVSHSILLRSSASRQNLTVYSKLVFGKATLTAAYELNLLLLTATSMA